MPQTAVFGSRNRCQFAPHRKIRANLLTTLSKTLAGSRPRNSVPSSLRASEFDAETSSDRAARRTTAAPAAKSRNPQTESSILPPARRTGRGCAATAAPEPIPRPATPSECARQARIPQFEGQNRQPKKKKKIEGPPDRQRQSVVEQQLQVLSPALDHRRGRAVHPRGDGIVGIPEAQSHLAPLGQKRQFHIFKHFIGHARRARPACGRPPAPPAEIAHWPPRCAAPGQKPWPADRPAPARKTPAASATAAPSPLTICRGE